MKRNVLALVFLIFAKIGFAGNDAGKNETMIINNLDTVVFDLSQSVINGSSIQFPVSIISDDTVNALDFSFRFDTSKLSFDSVFNQKAYLIPTYNLGADTVLRFSSYSLQRIENKTSLVSIYFTLTSGKIGKNDLNTILGFLNGDPCSIKVIDTISSGVGIDEIQFNESVGAYPNPVHDKLSVCFNSTSSIPYQVSINDITNKEIIRMDGKSVAGKNEIQISLIDLPKGVYLLNLLSKNSSSLKRIVIE